MRHNTVTFDTVRKIGLALPGAVEGTVYGSPALKVGDRMFACLAVHRSAEPDTLVVQVGFDARDDLIAAEPDVYYVTDHYVDHPTVLVRLRKVHRDALPDLLQMGWRLATASRRAGARQRKPRASKNMRGTGVRFPTSKGKT